MVVSIILDAEYMGMEERFKWFLKNCSYAKEQDYLIVTHECIKNKLDDLLSKCEDRFYEEFEMCRLSRSDIDKLNICYIPDAFFERIYNKSISRTDMLSRLYTEDSMEIYNYVNEFIEQELIKREEKKPEYILNCIHVFKFVKDIAKKYDISIVPYVFSAIRKVHGYTQTLYMANIDNDLFNSEYAKQIYSQYDKKKHNIYNRKEILALLGKRKNIPLIPLIDYEGDNEIGVIGGGCNIIPETFSHEKMTDDDLFYEIKNKFGNITVPVRLHPVQMDMSGVGRKHMKNDPIEFILSCRRLCTIQSQMILKAALWNKVTVAYGKGLPYSFIIQKNVDSNNVTGEADLNFLLFGYLVPDRLMFDKNYWNWRLTNPDVNSVYEKNHMEILKDLGIDYNKNGSNRYKMLLENRDLTQFELNQVLNGKINISKIQCLLSKFVLINQYGERREVYTLNAIKRNNVIETSVEVDNALIKYAKIGVFLLDGVDGEIAIEKLRINNKDYNIPSPRYYKKGEQTIELKNLPNEMNINIYIEWIYKNFDTIL